MRTVLVQTDRPYAVHIEAGILDRVGEFVRQSVGGQTAVLVSDDTVAALYGDRVEASLRAAGYETLRFVFLHGEASKNAETYLSLLNFLAEHRGDAQRRGRCAGGGVVGDLAALPRRPSCGGSPMCRFRRLCSPWWIPRLAVRRPSIWRPEKIWPARFISRGSSCVTLRRCPRCRQQPLRTDVQRSSNTA